MFIKRTGVWLDHSKAKLIVLFEGTVQITTVHSPYIRHLRIRGQKSDTSVYQDLFGSTRENAKHHIKQNELHAFYTDLENRLEDSDEILLFGPTNAKNELYNILLKNKKMKAKKIVVKNTAYITENQMIAVARKFFKPVSPVAAKIK